MAKGKIPVVKEQLEFTKIFHLRILYEGSGYYIRNHRVGTMESVHSETVTRVVYSGSGLIDDNGNYQLSSDFTGTITIANTVTAVKIIGNNPVQIGVN